MSLPFFYESEITPGTTAFTLSEETSKHCVKVLRMDKGEQLNLTDGKGNLFTASILIADKKNTEVRIDDTVIAPQQKRKISIASLPEWS